MRPLGRVAGVAPALEAAQIHLPACQPQRRLPALGQPAPVPQIEAGIPAV